MNTKEGSLDLFLKYSLGILLSCIRNVQKLFRSENLVSNGNVVFTFSKSSLPPAA